MVGRVLTNRNVVRRDGGEHLLLGYENLAPDQVQRLKAAWKQSFPSTWHDAAMLILGTPSAQCRLYQRHPSL